MREWIAKALSYFPRDWLGAVALVALGAAIGIVLIIGLVTLLR